MDTHIEKMIERNKSRRLSGHLAARNALYQDYRKGARRREYDFELSVEEFEEITMRDCYYCGAIPSKVIKVPSGSEYTYNGIDRVDNTKGYTLDNVVAACTTCNKAKLQQTQEEFEAWILRAAEYIKSRT